jgi:hypothetical protein
MPSIEYPVLAASIVLVLYFAGRNFVHLRRCVSSGKYSRSRAMIVYFFTSVLALMFPLISTELVSSAVERFGESSHAHSVFIGEHGLLFWFAFLPVVAVILLLNIAFSIALVFRQPPR